METYRTTILEPPLWPATSHGLRPGALPRERLACYLRPLGRISTDPRPDCSICEQILCKFQQAFAGPTILDSPNHNQPGSSKTDQPIETIISSAQLEDVPLRVLGGSDRAHAYATMLHRPAFSTVVALSTDQGGQAGDAFPHSVPSVRDRHWSVYPAIAGLRDRTAGTNRHAYV